MVRSLFRLMCVSLRSSALPAFRPYCLPRTPQAGKQCFDSKYRVQPGNASPTGFSLVELLLVLVIIGSITILTIAVTSRQLGGANADRAAAELMDALTLARSGAITTGDPHAVVIHQPEDRPSEIQIWRSVEESAPWEPSGSKFSFPDNVRILDVSPSFSDAGRGWMNLAGGSGSELVQRLIFDSQGRIQTPRRRDRLIFYLGQNAATASTDSETMPDEKTLPKIEVGARTGIATYHPPSFPQETAP